MIRRTHNDSLLGSKLLALEKPVKHDHKCHFSDVESEIYKIVKVRFVDREHFNDMPSGAASANGGSQESMASRELRSSTRSIAIF